MTLKQHKKEVAKLQAMELKLQTMILCQNNPDLNTLFFKWQDQRNFCNEGFVNFISKTLK